MQTRPISFRGDITLYTQKSGGKTHDIKTVHTTKTQDELIKIVADSLLEKRLKSTVMPKSKADVFSELISKIIGVDLKTTDKNRKMVNREESIFFGNKDQFIDISKLD